MTRAADWLIRKEVRRGDWSVKRPDTEPSGWAFEFANEFYPDIDDTAMVLLALLHAKGSDPKAQARPSVARSTGCSRCNRATGAGRHSTWTTTGRC